MGGSVRVLAFAVAVQAALGAFAFQPAPDAAVEALGTKKGAEIRTGLVFLNGKCLLPPFTVERKGTAVWVNGRQATPQIVDWNEFLKTQSNVKVTKTEIAPTEALADQPAVTQETARVTAEVPNAASAVESLNSLFDDDKPDAAANEPEKPAVVETLKKASAPAKAAARPKVSVSYSLEGDFVSNDESRKLLGRVDGFRLKVERALREGGLVCLGEKYTPVIGNRQMLVGLLDHLPTAMKEATSADDFKRRLRTARLAYVETALADDFYANRRDVQKLNVRRKRLQANSTRNKDIEEVSDPLF